MENKLKPINPEQAKSKFVFDPSKFKIGEDGHVIVNDLAFVEALRSASNEEGNNNRHSIPIDTGV